MKVSETIGNVELWKREKTLFLSSRHAPLSCYERVFQWIEEFCDTGSVVCFNTSEFEEEVLKALLVCRVPTILVVTKRLRENYNVQIELALKENRLLIMVLKNDEGDGNGFSARLRNQYVINQVQHIVCGYINPNGSIFGLLAGHSDVTYLVDRHVLNASEEDPKSFRWTVVEDKCLLRLFYEDMGIHAIHKAINRPYSTIYNRIKSLAMDDEVLKGREFEDYVVDFFDLPHNDKLALKEWRGDKTLPGIYPENNSAPDLVLSFDDHPFAIECKWRYCMPKDIENELLPSDRRQFFMQYAKNDAMPVFLLLGVGGLPSDPANLYMVPVSAPLSMAAFLNNKVKSPDDIFQQVCSTHHEQKHYPPKLSEIRKQYPNAYKPWSHEDDILLLKLRTEGKTVNELSALFQRNPGSIRSRLQKFRMLYIR